MFLNGELSSHLKNAGQIFSKDEKEKIVSERCWGQVKG